MSEPRILDLEDSSNISVKARFDRKKIDQAKNYDGHLMVTIESENKDFERTPVNAVLVLDVSASMGGHTDSGESKLDALKKVAARVVENMTAQDEIAIVAYSTAVDVILPGTSVTNKAEILTAIASIRTENSTNMSGGLLEGIRQINETFEGVRRVMLLTDGLANVGITGSKGLLDLVKDRDAKCTLSTFAFGTDANQELLADMAKAGEGNFYYIKGGSDVANVFARELGGIISCSAQNIEVTIKPNKGNEILEVLNDFTVEDKDGMAVIKAEDIYVGETKHVLLKVRVKKPGNKPKDRPFSIAHIDVAFDDLQTKKREKSEHNVKVRFVPKDNADEEPALEVQEQADILMAAKAQQEAVQLADAGNFAGARRMIRSGQRRLGSIARRGSKIGAKALRSFDSAEEDFSSEIYTSNIGADYSASAKGAMKYRAVSNTGMSNLFATSAQNDMVDEFAESTTDVPPDSNPSIGGSTIVPADTDGGADWPVIPAHQANHPGWVAPPPSPVAPPSPVVPDVKVPKSKSKSKSKTFGKKRSRK